MSIHKTLAAKGGLSRHRNVLTREERLRRLEREGDWDETKSVHGLPKVRNIMIKAGGKTKKKDDDGAESKTLTLKFGNTYKDDKGEDKPKSRRKIISALPWARKATSPRSPS